MDRFTEKLSNNTKPKTLGGRIRRLIKPNGIYKATILKEYNKLYDRLVEYEDLGFTPEQIRGLRNAPATTMNSVLNMEGSHNILC